MKLEELKALETSAAKAPWRFDLDVDDGVHVQHFNVFGPGVHIGGSVGWGRERDAELIASLRNIAPEILALVEACEYRDPCDYADDLAYRVSVAMEAFNAKLASL